MQYTHIKSLTEKLDQFFTAGSIQETSKVKLNKELGLKSL